MTRDPQQQVQDLDGEAAIGKVLDLVKKNQSCFFCTALNKVGLPISARPMTLLEVDRNGLFWFFSSRSSNKNDEITEDHYVHLFFQNPEKGDFLNVYGQATILHDAERIKRLWDNNYEALFPKGYADPELSIIQVKPVEGYYWDNQYGSAKPVARQVLEQLIGKKDDESKEGKLTL